MRIPRTLASLMKGVWVCERKVSNPDITMHGKVLFKSNTKQSLYEEEGTYFWEDAEHAYFQRQTWQWHPPHLKILTHDQRVLHTFDTESLPILHHTHQCGKDAYEATLHIISDNNWSLAYQVTGPKKNYQTLANFQRPD